MGTTLQVSRDEKGEPTSAVEMVDSPDDGGWYLAESQFNVKKGRRVSRKVFPSSSAAEKAWRSGNVKWEPWY